MDPLRFLKDWSSERGAELVEFALTFPLLLLVCLGIIDMGLLLQQHMVLTGAAREGARISVLPGYGEADIRARVGQYLLGTGLTPARVTTIVGQPQTLPVGGGACISVTPVTLTFNHEFIFLSGIGRFFRSNFGTTTLRATASMRNETPAAACPAGP